MKTIEQFMHKQRMSAENATPSHVPEVELDRTVAATMEALAQESSEMVAVPKSNLFLN